MAKTPVRPPTNWREAADALKQRRKPKPKGTGLMNRLDAIEKMLKEK